MPHYATLSTAECNAIHIAREYAPDAARKAMKREIFSRAKIAFGIPATHKMVVETDVQNSGAGVLKNRETRESYELNADGKWIGAANGAVPQRWFKLPKDKLHEAITDMLDNLEASDETIDSQEEQPNAVKIINPGTNDVVVIDGNGHAWVRNDADAFGYDAAAASSHEEEDDHPY